MSKRTVVVVVAWMSFLVWMPHQGNAVRASAQVMPGNASSAPSPRALLDRYCVTCHSAVGVKQGRVPVSLQDVDVANLAKDAQLWEKVVRKMRAGVMPPSGSAKPDKAVSAGLVSWLETELDRTAAVSPNPGRTDAFHRLNRAEYRSALRDLLQVDLDVSSLLPSDDSSYGFDNIAGILRFSPTLMERYLTAARKASAAAVGRPPSTPNSDVIRLEEDVPQDDQIDGLPFGTRGGTLIRYNFPADGEYVVRAKLAWDRLNGVEIPKFYEEQQLEISLDGERLKIFTMPGAKPARSRRPAAAAAADKPADPSDPATASDPKSSDSAPQVTATPSSKPGQAATNPDGSAAGKPLPSPPTQDAADSREKITALTQDWSVRFATTGGPHVLVATFLNRTPAIRETLVKPHLLPLAPTVSQWGMRRGNYLGQVEISGPYNPTGPGDTPSRRSIFGCRPVKASEEDGCARKILSALAHRAYRRPVGSADTQALFESYRQGRSEGGFDAGIEAAITRLLVSPEFLFRTEADPADVAANANYEVSQTELASRLSFFLWSSIPDNELLSAAERRTLKDREVYARQVKRMIADPRSQAIVDNFVGQWLMLRRVPGLGPDPYKDPDFDESLRQALQRETELFVESIIREDRSVLDLLGANYTFLNERLARHYGIPNIFGSHFRRVTLPEGSVRGGLLGQGSILAVTSQANRTSPVVRGKWILENILGTPAPAPPPNVPSLNEDTGQGQARTMRERMTEHRRNPVCASCHSMMDPLGFALENFDQAGRWRAVEESFDSRSASFSPIDSSGALPDGTKFNGPLELRRALMAQPENFVSTLVEKLLTYALGRGVEYYDMPTVRAITRNARAANYRFSSLVLGVAESVPFRMRKAPASDSKMTAAAGR